MAEALHPGYMVEGSNSLLHRIGQGVGHAAQMGFGITKAAYEGLSELRDPEIGILRSHRQGHTAVDQQVEVRPLFGVN